MFLSLYAHNRKFICGSLGTLPVSKIGWDFKSNCQKWSDRPTWAINNYNNWKNLFIKIVLTTRSLVPKLYQPYEVIFTITFLCPFRCIYNKYYYDLPVYVNVKSTQQTVLHLELLRTRRHNEHYLVTGWWFLPKQHPSL